MFFSDDFFAKGNVFEGFFCVFSEVFFKEARFFMREKGVFLFSKGFVWGLFPFFSFFFVKKNSKKGFCLLVQRSSIFSFFELLFSWVLFSFSKGFSFLFLRKFFFGICFFQRGLFLSKGCCCFSKGFFFLQRGCFFFRVFLLFLKDFFRRFFWNVFFQGSFFLMLFSRFFSFSKVIIKEFVFFSKKVFSFFNFFLKGFVLKVFYFLVCFYKVLLSVKSFFFSNVFF